MPLLASVGTPPRPTVDICNDNQNGLGLQPDV